MLKGNRPAFILEMPTYKFPQPGQILRTVWTNTWAFLAKAGTIIFVLSIILWAMAYYPRLPETRISEIHERVTSEFREDVGPLSSSFYGPWRQELNERQAARQQLEDKAVAAEQLRYSVSGRLGHVIEPVLKPLGYDWKMGVGLIAAFAAREVFVSHMGIVYSAGESEDDTADLESAMTSDTYPDGRPVWTPLVAISLLAWFVLAMQCMSTLAIVKRETGGWKWALGMLLYMNGLAYIVCLGIYQIGRIWFV
jgi:ferrous iron transport protein B